jgi:hypothetical protein
MYAPAPQAKLIPSIAFEQTIINALRSYLGAQNRLEIPLPLFAAVILLQVRGFRMSSFGNDQIDREVLQLPEVVIEGYAVDVGRILQPAFDALWQACGIERSMNYDEQSNWRPHKS